MDHNEHARVVAECFDADARDFGETGFILDMSEFDGLLIQDGYILKFVESMMVYGYHIDDKDANRMIFAKNDG